MKKIHSLPYYSSQTGWEKFLLTMRISLLLLTVGLLQVQASVYSQNTKFSLDVKNKPLREVFKKIETNSQFHFFFSDNLMLLDKVVNVKADNSNVEQILDKLLADSEYSYKVLDNNLVVIAPKNFINRQVNQITGTVTDATGNPLPGVNVVIKGTTIGTITDMNGKYSLSNVPPDAILVFSFVGMKNQEVAVAGNTIIDITMQEESIGIEEVVAIGYGTAKRSEYVGSVSSVKMENSPIELSPNLNVLESLKGNVSGLNIGATNSAGGQPSMLIRGQNSINGSNDPLIVLDGVIYLGSLSDINPNDIATIDILKDAVSSAVFGSRSANGVIAITTKRGSSGKPVVTLNISDGVQAWPNRPVMMKGDEYIKTVNARNQYTEGSTNWMTNQEAENYNAGKQRTWLDDVTRLGHIEDLQLSVSGAAKGLNYYLSTSYNYNKGVIAGDDFNRISILGKINTDITSWLKIGIDADYSRRDYSGFGADLEMAQKLSPYGVMYRDDQKDLEKYPTTQSYTNPLWGVDDNIRNNTDIRQGFRLNSYATVECPWLKGLSYHINFNPNYTIINSGNFYHEGYYVAEGDVTDASRYDASTIVNYLSKANGNLENETTYSYVWDNIVNYKNRFDKHAIEVTLVATRDYLKYNDLNTTGSDFSDNGNSSLGMWGLQYATVQKVIEDGYKQTNIGYLGRVSYSYNDKYYLTGSYRRDGASVFGANKKWGDFAAAGIAWRISEENFMKDIRPLNNLKLKLSWGQNGNQGISPYTTLSQVANGSSGGYRYEFSDNEGNIYYGLVQSTLGNADLGWEKTEAWNMGFESAWLRNRLFVDFDAYFSKTTDQIFSRLIPVMNGFKTIVASMGQVNNRGIEMTVRSINIQQEDWKWMTSMTFWQNRNKLVHLYGEDKDGDGKEDDDVSNSLFIGKSLGAIYGYEQDGIVQEDDADYIALTGSKAGYPKYKDLDGVSGITSSDRKILGYSKENFRLNMSNSISYKNFELYFLLSGIFGGNHYYMKSNSAAYMTAGTGRAYDNMTYKPYWTSENKSNKYPSATFAGDGRFLGLQSRGFVRVQDVSLSYTFKQQWVQAAKISALKVFFAAKNIATFTNWDGGDPETGALYLANTYPVVSTYLLGATISF